jgi:polysaccharide export outer membrane protein
VVDWLADGRVNDVKSYHRKVEMMKRVLFWLLLVIVLVSLNWFRTARAQETGALSAEQKQRLQETYRKKTAVGNDARYYQTPAIYDSVGEHTAPRGVVGAASTDTVSTDTLALDALEVAVPPTSGAEGPIPFEKLRPFGMDLFEGRPDIEMPNDIASAADYVLGPGDNVLIYLWGRVEREYNLTLDREGKVFIPEVGEVVGWGLTMDRFTASVKRQLSTAFSEFDVTVSLGKIRSIRVFVTGEVNRPGAFTVSSLTSLFNVLYIAGGPNERGSMREIRLMRRGKLVAAVDLYRFLLAGDNSMDVRLEAGDLIFVPVSGPRVAITGEINRPAIYELKGRQTAQELLTLAGNPTPAAHLDRVMLERIAGKHEWEVLDLDLNSGQAADSAVLMDGDRLTICSIFDARTNMVAIFGKVKHAGFFERNDSTHMSDLIEKGQLQPYDVYLDRANLYRRFSDGRSEVIPVNLGRILSGDDSTDLLLQDRDSVYVYSIDEVEPEKFVYVEGEVKAPGSYPLYDCMTVADLIFLAGSYTRGAVRHRAEIARIDSVGEVSLIEVALEGHESGRESLKEEDHVYVRRLPQWEPERAVTLEGEVMYPGRYTLSGRKETLYDLLRRAGGFTPNAFPEGTIFVRQSIRDNLNQLNVRYLLEKSQPLVSDSLGHLIKQGVFEYDWAAMNRIIIDVKKILATDGQQGNIVLEPDDRVVVPSLPSGISVMGAIGANGTLKFTNNKSVRDYITLAGNFTQQADKKGTRLIRASGEVVSGGGTLGKKVDMGDVILVPSRVEKQHNWLSVFTTALTATTGLLTSVYIVSKL